MENKENINTEEHLNGQQPENQSEQTEPTNTADVTTDEQAEAGEGRIGSELAELKDKYIRLYADFENLRRRTAKEKLELVSTATEGLMVALLPVLDDFGRALKSAETTSDIDALKEGVQLIFNKFYKVLEAKGLKPMEAQGQVFDADLHESIAQFPAPSSDQKGKVIDEVEKGYFLNDKVIRFAKVVVGS